MDAVATWLRNWARAKAERDPRCAQVKVGSARSLAGATRGGGCLTAHWHDQGVVRAGAACPCGCSAAACARWSGPPRAAPHATMRAQFIVSDASEPGEGEHK